MYNKEKGIVSNLNDIVGFFLGSNDLMQEFNLMLHFLQHEASCLPVYL